MREWWSRRGLAGDMGLASQDRRSGNGRLGEGVVESLFLGKKMKEGEIKE